MDYLNPGDSNVFFYLIYSIFSFLKNTWMAGPSKIPTAVRKATPLYNA
jgi:hypothetical protein